MRIIDGFTLRSVAGEMIVGGESIAQVNFNKLISLNESAAYLWQEVVDSDFTIEQLAALLVSKYEIDQERAMTDASSVAQSWIEVGLVEA
ncbi:MAG: PqqD family protein [Rikenellaceae bacterium]